MIFLLDRRGDAPVPPHAQVIESERALLESLIACAADLAQAGSSGSTAATNFLLRGAALCDWAQAVAIGRGWESTVYQSPLDALVSSFPRFTREMASGMWNELGEARETLTQPFRAGDLLTILHPDFQWLEAPHNEHAARWLLWREQRELLSAHEILLEKQLAIWRAQNEKDHELYAATSAESIQVLRFWLCLDSHEYQEQWGIFPIAVPAEWMQKVVQEFQSQLTREGVAAWEDKRHKLLPASLLEALATATADYLQHHSEQITPAILGFLSPFLSYAEAARLRALRRPALPTALPTRAPDVLRWVTDHYLPFRQWQVENNDSDSQVCAHRAALEFGRWFMKWYASALVGSGASHLATKYSEALRSSEESTIVLWVIADGLGWLDSQTVAQHLTSRYPRLSLARNEKVFASIPTITRFCKPALRWSTPPAEVEAAQANLAGVRRETAVSGHRAAETALGDAVAGEIVVWTPLEPDKTYHEIADVSVARANVEGALRALAENIAQAALSVPAGKNLRIVLTTDHGRMLSHSSRTHVIPNGFESHGRAAFAIEDNLAPRDYDDDGVCIQSTPDGGEVAFFDAHRFGLPVACAIALDDAAFVTNNTNRTGSEAFSHGGIFPEEIVVPWIEIERDAALPAVVARFTGRSKAASAGRVRIHLENPSGFAFQTQSVTLHIAGTEYSWPHELALAPYSTINWEIEIASWPLSSQWSTAKAIVILQLPDGNPMEVEATIETTSEEMQTRDDILGDL